MAALTAKDILGLTTEDLELKEFDVPEWKGSIYLRVLPAADGIALNDEMQALPPGKSPQALFMLLAAVVCDAEGKPLFTADDMAALGKRSNKVLKRIEQEALRHQGWLQAQEGDAGKGSSGAPRGASPTA